jgi:hypothetical protein
MKLTFSFGPAATVMEDMGEARGGIDGVHCVAHIAVEFGGFLQVASRLLLEVVCLGMARTIPDCKVSVYGLCGESQA